MLSRAVQLQQACAQSPGREQLSFLTTPRTQLWASAWFSGALFPRGCMVMVPRLGASHPRGICWVLGIGVAGFQWGCTSLQQPLIL